MLSVFYDMFPNAVKKFRSGTGIVLGREHDTAPFLQNSCVRYSTLYGVGYTNHLASIKVNIMLIDAEDSYARDVLPHLEIVIR